MKKKSIFVYWVEHDAIVVWCFYILFLVPWLVSLVLGANSNTATLELQSPPKSLPSSFWVFSLFPLALVVWLIYNRIKQSDCSVSDLLMLPHKRSIFIVVQRGFLVGLFLFFFGSYVIRVWCNFLENNNISASSQYLVEVIRGGSITPLQLAFLAIFVCVIAPIAEEILFRGILYEQLKKGKNKYYALLLSSLFFALVHTNLYALLGLFVVSIGLTLLYETHINGNKHLPSPPEKVGVLGSIVAHSTFNILNFVFSIAF